MCFILAGGVLLLALLIDIVLDGLGGRRRRRVEPFDTWGHRGSRE